MNQELKNKLIVMKEYLKMKGSFIKVGILIIVVLFIPICIFSFKSDTQAAESPCQLQSPVLQEEQMDDRVMHHLSEEEFNLYPPMIPHYFHEWLHRRYVVKSDDYFKKWELITIHDQPENLKWRWIGKDYPRVPCLLEFESYVKKYNLHAKTILSENDDPEIEFLPHDELYLIPYTPDLNDLHSLKLPRDNFDFVLLGQTLEHLYDPLRCLTNLYAHMAPGGYLFTNVPTFNVPHVTPIHFQHIFPDGLSLLMYRAGFEIIEIGQWGNRDYARMMVNGHTWPDINAMQKPIVNDRGFPVNTWSLVRKPLSGVPYYVNHSPHDLMDGKVKSVQDVPPVNGS